MKVKLYLVLAVFAIVVGCSRDPETVKRKFVENGDKYLAQGKYKQASIMYRNALKRDPKFGEAYAKLGEAEVRRGDFVQAINAFRRAVELLPDKEDAAGKLADIYLFGYISGNQPDKKVGDWLIAELQDLSDSLAKQNPNSFTALRIQGFLSVSKNDNEKALEAFRKADSVRPKRPEIRYAMAQILLKMDQWPEAEKICRESLKDSPEYLAPYDLLLTEYVRRGERAQAEEVLKAKVATHPNSARFRTQLAGYYYATQRPDEAEKVLSETLANETKYENAFAEVGDFYSRIREYPKAQSVYEQGVQKKPAEKTSFRLKLALLQVAQGKLKEALDTVEVALKDDPQNNDAISMRASLQLQTGDKARTQAAITDLQSLLSRTPNNPVVRYNLARAYHGRGEVDAARVQYAEAVKIRPDFLGARIGLGQVYLQKGEYGKAFEESEAILTQDPNNVHGRVIRVNALINSRNLQQARSEIETFLKVAPDSPDLQFQMALVNFFQGRYKEAESTFASLRQRFPADVKLAYAIAEVYMQTGRMHEALTFLMQEHQRQPDNLDIRKAVGNISMRVGALDQAEEQYRFLLGKEPQDVELYMRMGETLRRKGQTQASIDILRKGQQIQPNNPKSNLQLALTLDAAGLKRESLPIYESIVKVQPDNPIALNNLAFMLAEEGRDLDQALTYAQRARQQLPNSPDVADTLGWIYIKKNLSDNAVAIFKELTRKYQQNSTYHYHLGLALYQKGDKVGAKKSLQSALTLNPAKEDEDKIRELLSKVG